MECSDPGDDVGRGQDHATARPEQGGSLRGRVGVPGQDHGDTQPGAAQDPGVVQQDLGVTAVGAAHHEHHIRASRREAVDPRVVEQARRTPRPPGRRRTAPPGGRPRPRSPAHGRRRPAAARRRPRSTRRWRNPGPHQRRVPRPQRRGPRARRNPRSWGAVRWPATVPSDPIAAAFVNVEPTSTQTRTPAPIEGSRAPGGWSAGMAPNLPPEGDDHLNLAACRPRRDRARPGPTRHRPR